MNLERHRAPALWLVSAAIVVALAVAVQVGARQAIAVVVAVLALAAASRVAFRGRRPEGVAVRAAWVDVMLLAALASAIAVLSITPGV